MPEREKYVRRPFPRHSRGKIFLKRQTTLLRGGVPPPRLATALALSFVPWRKCHIFTKILILILVRVRVILYPLIPKRFCSNLTRILMRAHSKMEFTV